MFRLRTSVTAGLLALASLASATAARAAQVEGHFDRTLPVSGPVTLSVTSGSGSVAVNTGADSSVRVVGVVRGSTWWGGTTDAEVERAVRQVEASPPIVQNGSTISLGAIDDEAVARRVSISYEVTVPRTTSLTVKTGSGSQRIAALAGPVTSNTGSGSVTIGAIAGAVDVRTGSGSVKVDGARERVNVTTGSGSIALGKVAGRVAINTGSGSVKVEQAPDATIDVSTGSGQIEIEGLTGGLSAHSASGSIHVNGTPAADWQLHTSSGSIVLGIPEGSDFRVQASTSSGSINTDHKLAVSHVGRRELSGTVGDGGALVSAHSTSGSIRINR